VQRCSSWQHSDLPRTFRHLIKVVVRFPTSVHHQPAQDQLNALHLHKVAPNRTPELDRLYDQPQSSTAAHRQSAGNEVENEGSGGPKSFSQADRRGKSVARSRAPKHLPRMPRVERHNCPVLAQQLGALNLAPCSGQGIAAAGRSGATAKVETPAPDATELEGKCLSASPSSCSLLVGNFKLGHTDGVVRSKWARANTPSP